MADFKAVFPKHTNGDQSWGNDFCDGNNYQWVDVDLGAAGVYAYLKNEKIYQLRIQTPRFSLSDGIKMHASEEQVKRLYPRGKKYVLRYSGSAVVGGRDLQYWVDERSGVAFELYWNQRDKLRHVSSIDIFVPGAAYQPEGCVSPPQEWIRK